ncbi:hypothetical protein ONS96_001630 [Cadophora gregata f. sp. sojae]|nr:hypothetical protein ONS96_001630 [Cadophora gregata f. sp. sojae]
METMIQSESQRRLGRGDNEYAHYAQNTTSKHHSPIEYCHTFSVSSDNSLDEFMAQSWIPEPLLDLSWNDIRDVQDQWQHATSLSSQGDFAQHCQTLAYPLSSNDSAISVGYSYDEFESQIALENGCGAAGYQPCMGTVNHVAGGYGPDFPSQTPQIPVTIPAHQSAYPLSKHRPMNSTFHSNNVLTGYTDTGIRSFTCNTDLSLGTTDVTWIPFTPVQPQQHHIATTTPPISKPEKPTSSPVGLSLDWSTSEQPLETFIKQRKASIAPAAKRKYTSPRPSAETVQPDCHIEECVSVFENAPGALATVKKRKKLDEPVRKAARDVRKAGACHQCRFRKRTCSTGTPCGSCLKTGKGLHEIRCQRESPFIGKPVHEYFEYSSTRRVVSFDIFVTPDALDSHEEYFVLIDGVDRLSHPIRLRARRKLLNSFTTAEQVAIRRTQDRKKLGTCTNDAPIEVTILEDDETLGTRVEQWAVEYSSQFVHAADSKFQCATIAVILGTAYVKKGLPESPLVAAMLRVASLAFILRAGVKCTPTPSPNSNASDPPSHAYFRTTEATVDTILYQRLQLACKDLFTMLQRLVFRKAGFLTREQIYPVALVFWQILRILCLGASHLSNIVMRFNEKARGQSDFLTHTLKLLLSTHLALFRSSNPLLLSFTAPSPSSRCPSTKSFKAASKSSSKLSSKQCQKSSSKPTPSPTSVTTPDSTAASPRTKESESKDTEHKNSNDLLGNDPHLLDLANKMRDTVLTFREKGCPEMKGSMAFKKEYLDLFRSVYVGL